MTTAVYDLSRAHGPQNRGTPKGEADPTFAQSVLGSGHLVQCPMSKERQPVALCATCPHFQGLGRVDVTGSDDPLKTSRIMCGYPRSRPLALSSVPLRDDYRKYLKDAIDAHANLPGRDAKVEHSLFVERSVAVNCPLSRARTGTWRIERPPCPACKYFRGISPGERGPVCRCAHMFSITMGRSVVGSPAMLG